MLSGRTVLILEDEVIVAFALEDMLLDMGAGPVMATSIEQAEAALDRQDIALAVLDVNVNGIRSYDFAGQLAERSIPFVFATGYGDNEHPEHFAAVPTLTKPYSREQLAEILAAVA